MFLLRSERQCTEWLAEVDDGSRLSQSRVRTSVARGVSPLASLQQEHSQLCSCHYPYPHGQILRSSDERPRVTVVSPCPLVVVIDGNAVSLSPFALIHQILPRSCSFASWICLGCCVASCRARSTRTRILPRGVFAYISATSASGPVNP